MPDPKPPCRQCSECDGNHHWLETCCDSDDGPADPHFICKHCDARADCCEECDGPVFPPTLALCAECSEEQDDAS